MHTVPDHRVVWLTWNAEAFARAARERKPVLLSITTAWSHACREMERTTYADERVAQLIENSFVAIRVDADRRPDINERYNLGGWPTTAFLTPEGDLLGGGTFVLRDRMPGVLSQVIDAMETRRAEIEEARTAGASGDHLSQCGREPTFGEVVESTFSTFDETYGGFGLEPKFPLTPPLHLALAVQAEEPALRWASIVERTLAAMRDAPLHDCRKGGFYRYANTRDWGLPNEEKLLETNAALLRIYAEASRVFEDASLHDVCAELVAYVTRLKMPAGGYAGSEAETMVYTDTSAAAAGALIAASVVLGDSGIGRDALEQLERVLLSSYRPGQGIAHYVDGSAHVRGLLTDHVAMIHALIDAHDAGGAEPYGMMAEELTHYVLQTLWDDEARVLFDRADDREAPGWLRARRSPFVLNAEAARALARVARSSGEPDFRQHAETIAHSIAPAALSHGPLGAHYLLALRELSVR